jgi:hypothetical protein
MGVTASRKKSEGARRRPPSQPQRAAAGLRREPAGSRWPWYSSYCWRRERIGARVDMAAQTRTDVGTLRVVRGQGIGFHLAFRPRQVHLAIYRGNRFTHHALTPRRMMTWRVRGLGMLPAPVR